ncbi:hypothetical protein BS78_09G075400 [Paspalum vaginatum]|nr:hypothetical protein BS78_09G075400 [Paspalum vaginatum]
MFIFLFFFFSLEGLQCLSCLLCPQAISFDDNPAVTCHPCRGYIMLPLMQTRQFLCSSAHCGANEAHDHDEHTDFFQQNRV